MPNPKPKRNPHASQARILERLIILHKNGRKWVTAKEALGPSTETGPWSEDMMFLVSTGWVESEDPPNQMGDNTRVRLPAMTITTLG